MCSILGEGEIPRSVSELQLSTLSEMDGLASGFGWRVSGLGFGFRVGEFGFHRGQEGGDRVR